MKRGQSFGSLERLLNRPLYPTFAFSLKLRTFSTRANPLVAGCASKRPRSGEGEEALESPRTGGSKSESLVAEAVVVRLVALREDVLAVCATRLSRRRTVRRHLRFER